jgi:hypothetical protein
MARRRGQSGSRRGLPADELTAQQGTELPERHAMSLISGLPSLGDTGGLTGTPTDTTSPVGGVTPTDGTTTPTDTAPTDGGAAPPPADTTSSTDTTGTPSGDTTAPAPGTSPAPASAPITRDTVIDRIISTGSQGAGAGQNAPITQSS